MASFSPTSTFTRCSRSTSWCDAVVLLGQFDLRAVLLDELLGFGDGAVDAAQQLIAGRAVQAGRFDLLPRLFQHRQGALGIGVAHGAGVRFLVGQFGGDLPGEHLLPGRRLVGQRRGLARPAAAGFGRDGADSNCRWSCRRWAVTGSSSFMRAAAWRKNS